MAPRDTASRRQSSVMRGAEQNSPNTSHTWLDGTNSEHYDCIIVIGPDGPRTRKRQEQASCDSAALNLVVQDDHSVLPV